LRVTLLALKIPEDTDERMDFPSSYFPHSPRFDEPEYIPETSPEEVVVVEYLKSLDIRCKYPYNFRADETRNIKNERKESRVYFSTARITKW